MKHTHKANLEWGRKARKEEDELRGMNATDRRMAIAEQYQSMVDDIEYCAHDRGDDR